MSIQQTGSNTGFPAKRGLDNNGGPLEPNRKIQKIDNQINYFATLPDTLTHRILNLFHPFDSTIRCTVPLVCKKWKALSSELLDLQLKAKKSITYAELDAYSKILSEKSSDGPVSILDVLERYQNLQTLDFSGCAQLEDEQLEEILKKTPQLKRLILDDCTNLGIPNIPNLPSLELLSFRNCSDLIDVCLVDEFTGLQTLDLSGCTKITSIDFLRSEDAPNLQTLNLNGCENLKQIKLKNRSLVNLFASNCKQLEFVKLKSMPNLNVLDLSSNNSLFEIQIPSLVNLVYLNLSDCTALNDIQMRSLFALKFVGFINCSNLSGINKKDSGIQLEVVYIKNCPLSEVGAFREDLHNTTADTMPEFDEIQDLSAEELIGAPASLYTSSDEGSEEIEMSEDESSASEEEPLSAQERNSTETLLKNDNPPEKSDSAKE